MEDRYFRILQALYPLHRTLVSDDTDRAIGILQQALRELGVPDSQILLHEFPSGSELSTWIAPLKWVLSDFKLIELGARERVIVDSSEISLSVAEYSQPVDAVLDWEELAPHLFYSERRPNAIPFVFRFFYRPGYGFCIRKSVYDTLDRRARYRAFIDSRFEPGRLKCLEAVLPGTSEESLLVMSNICHPFQANDSLTGAINNLMLIERFIGRRHRHTLRFGFWPETIGAQGYFSKYFDRRSLFKFALFTEMLGTGGPHALQLSRQEASLIDRVARYVLARRDPRFVTGRYTALVRNDERVSNGPNLDIPTISLTRWPYEEYHTSDDNPSIIRMESLRDSAEATGEILEILDQDRTLMAGEIFGQPFLTRFGLFHDFQDVPPGENRNKILEDIFSYSDGKTSLFEIASRFDYPWALVNELADGLLQHGLYRVRDRASS